MVLFLAMISLAGCEAFSSNDSVATIGADLTMYAVEGDEIRIAATAEQEMVVATLVAANTQVAELSLVNAALGATMRAISTSIPQVRPVVVSADDMGNSLDREMMDDEAEGELDQLPLRVSDLAISQATDPDSGCSTGSVRQFTTAAEKIFVTARVTGLRASTYFEVDWLYQDRSVYDTSWLSSYSKAFECIWFYATPADFPFLPGLYTASLWVDGEQAGSTTFTILSS